ncbi:calcium-binding protein [Vibrio hyugaensis]|uniref:calcium-binding protein n=1 Tax=Vibrio hyugaensis TaxID=1534743 RepID=UPI003DA02544
MADEISVTETNAQVGNLVDGPTQDGVPRDVDNHLQDNSGADLEVRAGKGDDIVKTGDGDDFIASGRGSEAIKSGDGNDVIESWNHTISAKDEAGENPNIDLARDGDVENVGCVDDIIVAGSGNDYVEGGGNNDIIYGDRGAKLSGEEILVNGDFEDLSGTTQLGGGNNWGTYSSIPGWEADDNLDGVAPVDLTKDLEGLIEIQENGGYGVEQGDGNVLELDSHTHRGQDSHSAIGQYFELDEAGTFNLSLDYADRTGNAATNGFKLYIDGEVVGNPEGYGGAAGDPSTSWRSLSIDVDLGAGPHVLTIEAIGTQDTYGSLIDNVSLQQYEANDVLIGDGTPRDGNNVDNSSVPGDDLIRGNKGADVLIGDNFDALSFNEQTGNFELDLDSAQTPEGEGLGLDNATAYNPDGSEGNTTQQGSKYGVEGTDESGKDAQIGYSYDDGDSEPGDAVGSEMLSVCFDEHTMAAKVGISNLYANEGRGEDDDVDEVGIWTAFRDGIEVASGFFSANDPDADTLAHYAAAGMTLENTKVLSTDSNNSGEFSIGPNDTGFKAFDEIQFSAAGEQFSKGGEKEDSSDYFVTSVETLRLTGDGTDMLYGGRGDDVLLGGDNNEILPAPSDGMYDISQFNGTFDVELIGSNAGFNNSLGFYTADSSGEVVNVGILWSNVKQPDEVNTSISKEMMGGDACKLGFFVVPDGADNGIESEGFIDVSEFDLDAQLLGEAAFELGLPIHAQISPLGDGTSLFEWNDNTDLSTNDDDFNDVIHNVTTVAEPELLNGGRGDDWLDGGAGVDILKGGKGDDVIIGGSGADEVRGGQGNDLIAYDAEDTLVRGGKGFDVLVANDKDGPVDIDMSKGQDADDIKGIEAVIGTSSDQDSVTLTLGKVYHQGGASDNTKSKDDGQSEFFALGVEDIKLDESNGWSLENDSQGAPDDGVTMTVADLMASSDYKLDQGMIDSLGLSGSDVLTAYTFTKGGKEVVIYTDAAFDGDFQFV